ncbi:MAG TPA: hypothetical protein VGA55_07690 [Bacteroidota bacterium]
MKNGKLQYLTENKKEFLAFLKTRYKLYHRSNVFFRDLHYGVMTFLASKEKETGYTEAEGIANRLVQELETTGTLKKIDGMAYLLEYPEFKKPPVKPAIPAKPTAAAPKPAAAPAKPAAPPASVGTAKPAAGVAAAGKAESAAPNSTEG